MRVPGPFAAATAGVLLAYGGAALRRPLQDPDLWWLLWAGEGLLRGRPPEANGLSWTAPEHPWTLHEPLVAAAMATAGVHGIVWLRAGVVSALLLALGRAAARAGSGWAALLGLAWALPLVSVSLSERAMAWGALAWALLVLLLRGGPLTPWRRGAAAALVVLWSATHASFAPGLATLLLLAPGAGALAALGVLALPGGPDRVALLLDYGGRSPALALARDHIVEWTPWAPDDAAWALRGLLAAMGLAACLASDRGRPLLVTLALAALSLKHRRFVDLLAIWATPGVCAWLAARLPARPLGRPLPLAALGLAALALAPPAPGLDAARFPPALPAALAPGLPTWADLELGAWLATRGTPAFWDARNDCYPLEVVVDGLRVARRAPGWEQALTAWGVARVVTRDAALARALRARGWVEEARAGSPPVVALRSPSQAATMGAK